MRLGGGRAVPERNSLVRQCGERARSPPANLSAERRVRFSGEVGGHGHSPGL
jgi:hypothetical protein